MQHRQQRYTREGNSFYLPWCPSHQDFAPPRPALLGGATPPSGRAATCTLAALLSSSAGCDKSGMSTVSDRPNRSHPARYGPTSWSLPQTEESDNSWTTASPRAFARGGLYRPVSSRGEKGHGNYTFASSSGFLKCAHQL